MVRLEVVENSDCESAIASPAVEPTIHAVGISGTARNRTAFVKSIAGMRKNASGDTARILAISNVMLPPRLRGEKDDKKRPKQRYGTIKSPLRKYPTVRRGHAAKKLLQLSAIGLGAMIRDEILFERHHAIAAMSAVMRSGEYGIVSASG